MKLLAWLIYVPLQIMWLPLSVIGGAWVAYKQIWRSRDLGLSQTAVEIVNGRWTGHVFGLRRDSASYRLAAVLPNNSVIGLRLALFPLWVARTVAGKPILYPLLPDDAEAGIASMVFSRSARFDELIEDYAGAATQLVVLGAGLDTRAYGPLANSDMTFFEIDRVDVQRAKRKAVSRAGLAANHVHYIEADLGEADWVLGLVSSTYDPTKITIFLWEGVTLYLTEAVVRTTLASLRAHAAPGSVVVLDLYAQGFLKTIGRGVAAAALKATSESLDFGLDFSTDPHRVLSDFATSANVQLVAAHFIGSANRSGPYMTVAAFRL